MIEINATFCLSPQSRAFLAKPPVNTSDRPSPGRSSSRGPLPEPVVSALAPCSGRSIRPKWASH